MAKVFRLHEGTEGTGWFLSTEGINKEHLKTIKTEGKEVATSIPSPYARIDLVKSAFGWCTDNGIYGTTAQHKLVSDTLDVAQLFYASQRYQDKIGIVAWNPNERFKEIIEQGNSTHSKFASTLQLFWNQDSVQNEEKGDLILYNFESVRRLYFLLNKETNQVIGGTSPITLFFASPDVRRITKNLNIVIGQDKLFDDEYTSLAEREVSFIEYIYALSKQERFSELFPEVYSYIEEVRLNHINDNALRGKIANFDSEEINNYSPCPVLKNEDDPCEILGIRLGIQTFNGNNIENESDFIVKSDYEIFNEVWDTENLCYKTRLKLADDISVHRPLILPYHKFTKKWTYTTKGIIWDENTKIPYLNNSSPKNSVVPIQNDHYYWITIGNLLEEKIIKLPYPIDNTKFITCGSKNYLLPLTPLFFKYFDVEKVSNYFKLTERADGNLIEVELKIPVKGGYITYKKNYSSADKNIDILEIHLAIFPFLKTDSAKVTYNLGVLDDRDKEERINELILNCYNLGKEVENLSPVIRNPGTEGGEIKSLYFKCENQFDVIRLGNKTSQGFIVPKMKSCNGTNQIHYAIDFGTTNTHIEYKISGQNDVEFDNTPATPLWQSLMDRMADFKDKTTYLTTEETFDQEILPFYLSKDDNQPNFPMRTALIHNKQINFNEPIEIIRQINNYLLLERLPIRSGYLELHTDLKWSNYANPIDEKRVKSYIEYLATIILYKTLLLGGDVSQTTIIWFYPVSMDKEELGVFNRVWKEVYRSVFKQEPTENYIKGIPESIAPYFFYNKPGLNLSIDIGGGSSDIAVFDKSNDRPDLISSFKFAGNAIFGDGYSSERHRNNSDRNGFVKTYKDKVYEAINGKEKPELILNNILNIRKSSSDFSSYLFALEKEGGINFSYSDLLTKDKKLKLPIFVFYGAIIFYAAKLMKKSGIKKTPKHILFSGTASKTALIIDATEKFSFLTNMFQFIFSKIYNVDSVPEISIELSKIPKEITCKGALKAGIKNVSKNSPIRFWLGGNSDSLWGDSFDKELDVHKTPKYVDINKNAIEEIENSIKEFYSILDDFGKTIRIEDKIEPNAYSKFQDIRDSSMEDFLIKGIKAYYKKDEYHIEESLFFYPLIGILNELSYSLAENHDEK